MLKGRAYVRQGKGQPGIWVAQRDYDMMRVNGAAVMPDMVYVPSEQVVLEVDQDALTSRPIGIISKPENLRLVAKHARTERSARNRLVRISDLVTLKEISWRTRRHINTIIELRLTHGDWPEHWKKFGTIKLYYWPEIAAWFQAHGLKVKLEKRKAS